MLTVAAMPDESAPFKIDFHRLFATLRRNAVLIVSIMGVVMVLGIVATMLMTPVYTASGSVQIEQEAARVLKSGDDLEPAPALQDAERFLQTQTDILRSRAMAIRVAQDLRLFDNAKFLDSIGAGSTSSSKPEVRREAVLKLFANNLKIKLPRQSRVVSISFSSPDRVLAAQIVNAYARAFIQSNLQRKYDSSSYARDFLARELAGAKERLETSERTLNSYARDAGLIKTGVITNSAGNEVPSQSLTTASLAQLNEVGNQARATRIAAEQKWNSARGASVLSIPQVAANPAIQDLLRVRATKTAELQLERARHLESHPSVQQLQAEVTEIEQQLNRVAGSIRDGIRLDYQVALQQERAIEAQVGGLKNATLAEQDRGVRYNILSREADTNRTMYEGLLQRFKELSASAGLSANNISVIDQAEPPIVPSSPKLWLNLALSLVAGAAVALGVVFIREQIDDSVRVPEDAERKLGLPVIGVIPVVDGGSVIDELLSPRTAFAEAYHALRTSLIYSSPEGVPGTLLITSSQPSEGKSTTAFALAHDLARLGRTVVLIDSDLRRPSLHRLMGSDNSTGLVDLITQNTSEDRNPIRPTPYENLSFISSGPIPPSPTELLSSVRMSELLQQLQKEFDVVVIDGPPVLGLADAPLLSMLAEATIFVIEAHRSHRGGAKAAIRRLRDARAQMLGCVLTKFDPKRASAQYYGYEYYYYGSETHGEAKSKSRTQRA